MTFTVSAVRPTRRRCSTTTGSADAVMTTPWLGGAGWYREPEVTFVAETLYTPGVRFSRTVDELTGTESPGPVTVTDALTPAGRPLMLRAIDPVAMA